jgi:hypothetical protein
MGADGLNSQKALVANFAVLLSLTKELESYAQHTKRAWVSGKASMSACYF